MRKFLDDLLTIIGFIGLFLAFYLAACLDAYGQSYPPIFNRIRQVEVTDSAGLSTALSNAQPGDEITLADGASFSGLFIISRAGTLQNPIVIKSAGHSILAGGFRINAPYNYVADVEITGGSVPGIELFCSNCGAMRNYIHDLPDGMNGIGAWNSGSNQVIAFNIIVHNRHNIYTQNAYNTNGVKYFIGNYIADVAPKPDGSGNEFNFHAYAEGNQVSGFRLERNIIENGRILIGSISSVEPDHHIVFNNNYTYRANSQFGYRRPIVLQAEDNYFGRSSVTMDYQWGRDEQCTPFIPLQLEPSKFSRNKLYFFQTGKMFSYRTSKYNSACSRQDGLPLIELDEERNNNLYGGAFQCSFNAGNVNHVSVTKLTDFIKYTRDFGGRELDTNSTSTTIPPSTEYFYIQDDFNSDRGFLVVYNWSSAASLDYTHSKPFTARKAKDPYGAPVVVSDVAGHATFTLSSEFEVFLIDSSGPPPEPEPTCSVDEAYAMAMQIMADRLDPATTHAQKVRRMGRKDLELIECLELMMEN